MRPYIRSLIMLSTDNRWKSNRCRWTLCYSSHYNRTRNVHVTGILVYLSFWLLTMWPPWAQFHYKAIYIYIYTYISRRRPVLQFANMWTTRSASTIDCICMWISPAIKRCHTKRLWTIIENHTVDVTIRFSGEKKHMFKTLRQAILPFYLYFITIYSYQKSSE